MLNFIFYIMSYWTDVLEMIDYFMFWKINKPEYFFRGAGNSTTRSIALGHMTFPAPRGKGSDLLTWSIQTDLHKKVEYI